MLKDKFIKESSIVKTIAVYTLIGTAVSLIAMAIFAGIIVILQLDRNYAAPLATVSVALGGFAASFAAGKKRGEKGYLLGFLNGLAVFALVTIISLCVSSFRITLNTLFHFIIILTASTAGGIIGVNRARNKKYVKIKER